MNKAPEWLTTYIFPVMTAVVLLIATIISWNFEVLHFVPVSRDLILDLLSPLLVIALFLERALEVFISVWRDEVKRPLRLRVQTIKEMLQAAKVANNYNDVQQFTAQLEEPRNEVAKYEGETRSIALVLGLIGGVLIALVGVRVLDPITDMNQPLPNDIQAFFFNFIDIFLTGGIIGGGSEGIHRLISVIVSTLDKYRLDR